MGSSSRAAQSGAEPAPGALDILQAATRVLAGVALRRPDVLGGAVTLPQFRMPAVLAALGQAGSVLAARALGPEASTVTRLADRMVAGYASRGTGALRQLVEAAGEGCGTIFRGPVPV